jgi:hypothetical protein
MKRVWPIIGVRDVQASSQWYQSILGCANSHPSTTFDQIVDTDGTVLVCLHHWAEHEHPSLMTPTLPRQAMVCCCSSASMTSMQRSEEHVLSFHASKKSPTKIRTPKPWNSPSEIQMAITSRLMPCLQSNQALQPTAGRCEVHVTFMKQLSILAKLAPASSGLSLSR